jgi:hypothetical protein
LPRVERMRSIKPQSRACSVLMKWSRFSVRSKQNQADPNKIAWICLVLFVRIGTFQWVAAETNKNSRSPSPPWGSRPSLGPPPETASIGEKRIARISDFRNQFARVDRRRNHDASMARCSRPCVIPTFKAARLSGRAESSIDIRFVHRRQIDLSLISIETRQAPAVSHAALI